MKLEYTKAAARALAAAPVLVRRAFYKQAACPLRDLRHPSLRAKKYSEAEDVWQARVRRGWRFYFKIVDDTYLIERIKPHPKK